MDSRSSIQERIQFPVSLLRQVRGQAIGQRLLLAEQESPWLGMGKGRKDWLRAVELIVKGPKWSEASQATQLST